MIREFAFPDIFYLLEATRWTLLLALVATVGGGLLGLVVAVARVVPAFSGRRPAIVFTSFSTPSPVVATVRTIAGCLPCARLSMP